MTDQTWKSKQLSKIKQKFSKSANTSNSSNLFDTSSASIITTSSVATDVADVASINAGNQQQRLNSTFSSGGGGPTAVTSNKRRNLLATSTPVPSSPLKVMHHKRTESLAAKLNDVIVIGAGLSGLSAAKVLHDKGLNVLVLEARDRVGGRTLSDENGSDLGGSYFVQEHRNLVNLIADLGLRSQADVPPTLGGCPAYYSNESKTTHRRSAELGNQNQVPFASGFNLLARLDFIAARRRINELCSRVDLAEPWNSNNASDLDSISFKQFIEKTCYTIQVKKFFLNLFAPLNFTNEAEDCSLLYALRYISAWGGVEKCIGMDGGGLTSRIVGGSQLLSVRLRLQIGEERVLLNKSVHTIDQQTNSEQVTVFTRDGSRYEASRIIVALPPNLQTSITFKPNLPLKSQLNQRFPAGLCTKVILYYEQAYWSDNGFNGQLFVLDHKQANKKDRSFRRNDRCARNGGGSNGANNKRGAENRRSVCKTSSSSDKDDNLMYSSSNSLQQQQQQSQSQVQPVPPSSVDGGSSSVGTSLASDNNGGGGGDSSKLAPLAKSADLKRATGFYPRDCPTAMGADYCPVSFVWPDYSRGQPSLIAHVCGYAWLKYHEIKNQEDRISLVARSYARIFHSKLAEPLAFKELDWVEEEYSRGAYTSITQPGTLTKFGQSMGAPFGRIVFASSELSVYWPSTMEGAIRSGRKAAQRILKDLQRVDSGSAEEEGLLAEDDDELLIQPKESFLERNSQKLLYLTHLALTTPSLILIAAALGFSVHRISFRCSVGF